jgi:hypothetical protein
MDGRDEKCIQGFGRKTWTDHSEELDLDGKIVMERISGK